MDYDEAKVNVSKYLNKYLDDCKYDKNIIDGVKYILDGGKKLRSIITLSLLEKMLPDDWKEYKELCLIPEFIHSSSLIIDDLPGFDDGTVRRNKECIHLKYTEGFAYIISYNLITESMLLLHGVLPKLKKMYELNDAFEKYEKEMLNIMTNLSATKALGGQLLSTYEILSTPRDIDYYKSNKCEYPKISRNSMIAMLSNKTSSFFEISIMLPWIIGNGDLNKLDLIKEFSKLLGINYQIYDDFIDYFDDVKDNTKGIYNYVYNCGIDESFNDFNSNMEKLEELEKELNIKCKCIDHIKKFMIDNIIVQKNNILEKLH
jgi:geranylgeranyl diphosphate synthase, type II